jgi:agmatine deiminase
MKKRPALFRWPSGPLAVLLLVAAALLGSCRYDSDKFHMPAEWEPHEAVWLGWEKDSSLTYYPVIGDVITALKSHVTVKLAFDNDSLMRTAQARLLKLGVDTSGIRFYVLPGERYWIRDNGAAFLVNEKGQLGVADFAWNEYGRPGFLKLLYSGNMDSVTAALPSHKRRLARGRMDSLMAVAEGATILKTNVIHEGGAIEVNGKGTLILCEATVFQRNPTLSKAALETEFKRVLGVTNIIWMKQGLADDPHQFYRRITGRYVGGGTGGHTDEFVRFANPNTLLLAWVDESEKDRDPLSRMNYERMSENLAILEKARDQNGKPFTIIKVPLPDLIARLIVAKARMAPNEVSLNLTVSQFIPSERPKPGDSLRRVAAASYLNYLVTNGLVLLPTYVGAGSSREKEDRVRRIFERQFPGREIRFFDVLPQNWQGGGLHCSTQQQPKLN